MELCVLLSGFGARDEVSCLLSPLPLPSSRPYMIPNAFVSSFALRVGQAFWFHFLKGAAMGGVPLLVPALSPIKSVVTDFSRQISRSPLGDISHSRVFVLKFVVELNSCCKASVEAGKCKGRARQYPSHYGRLPLCAKPHG
jgi:hypothetical protein